VKQRELPAFAIKLGPVPVQLKDVALDTANEGSAAKANEKTSAAQVGMDAVSQFGTFILDFEQMRVDGRLKTAAERHATHKIVLTQKDVQVDDPKARKPSPPK
jgi:hypothetical protein